MESLILHTKQDSNVSLLASLYSHKDYILITDKNFIWSQKKHYKIVILVQEICTTMWIFQPPTGHNGQFNKIFSVNFEARITSLELQLLMYHADST